MNEKEFVERYEEQIVEFMESHDLRAEPQGVRPFLARMYDVKRPFIEALPLNHDMRMSVHGTGPVVEVLANTYPRLYSCITLAAKMHAMQRAFSFIAATTDLGPLSVIEPAGSIIEVPVEDAWMYACTLRGVIEEEREGRAIAIRWHFTYSQFYSATTAVFSGEGQPWNEEYFQSMLAYTKKKPFMLRGSTLVDWLLKHSGQNTKVGERARAFLESIEIEFSTNDSHSLKCRIGEVLKGGGLLTTVSANPLDFLSASTNCSYGSCFRPGGEYFNGCIAYAVDPEVLISYTASLPRADYKLGRRWLRLRGHAQGFCAYFGRVYGTFPETNCASVLPLLTPVARESLPVPGAWSSQPQAKTFTEMYPQEESMDDCGSSALYLDSGCLAFSFGPIGESEVFPSQIRVIKRAAYCLVCGKTTQNSTGGCCSDCDESKNYCRRCGDRCSREDLRTGIDDELYCEDCFDEMFSHCERCGEAEWQDQITAVRFERGYTEYWCICCAEHHTFSCDHCGELYSSRIAYRTMANEDTLCLCCFDDVGFACEDCGENFYIDDHALSCYGRCDDCQEELNSKEEEEEHE